MIWLIYLVIVIILSSIKIVYQYELGVKFTLGKYAGLIQPGLRLVIPVIQSWRRIDMRVNVIDVPDQDCLTKDNVSVRVNAVLYFKVGAAEKAVIQVEDFIYAVSQLSQTTMRNVVGEVDLDGLLSNRDQVSDKIQTIVDKSTDPWGIKVVAVDVKDVVLPEQMKRTMAKQAESERERRALILTSEGEKAASMNIMKAAEILSKSKGAIHLRTLQNFNDISSDQTNTIVFAVPIESLGALEGYK
ncbi:slipin family protein [Candidatus Woesearchaeota archaeon]|nr:slipin family protein [Candidatus Woesearchaeota archaeon]